MSTRSSAPIVSDGSSNQLDGTEQQRPSELSSFQQLNENIATLISLKNERKQKRQWENQRLRRDTQRRHLIDAGSALAIVAALIGGGVLDVLLSPAWAQVSATSAVGACQDCDSCEFWRSLFLITASAAFCFDMFALVLTVGGKLYY